MECLQVIGLIVVVNIIPFSKGISTGFCTGDLRGVILVVFKGMR
jgi:hypothetical protein